MPEAERQPGDVIGDYRLERLVTEDQMTSTWEAEQISMQRLVVLEMLKSSSASDVRVRHAFLEDIRAKALLTHSGVGAVYEAVNNEQHTFVSRERLDGSNLEELSRQGRKFIPLEVVVLLGQIARTMLHLEEHKVATVDFALHHFLLVGKDQMRLANLAVEGSRTPMVDTRAKALLGEFFDGVVKQGYPGATRVKSLCGFMRDPGRPLPLTWKQISDLCEQVREQLLEEQASHELPSVAETVQLPKEPARFPASLWALLGGLAIIALVIFLMVISRDPKLGNAVEPVVQPPKLVEIPAGTYRFGETDLVIRKGFTISRGEVSVGDYEAFLEAPDLAQYRHPEQPTSKNDHQPDDWEAIWRAAVKGEEWQGRPMSLGCPIVGIDWWDAYAYAQWKGGRLPTLAEWTAAALKDGAPEDVADWGKTTEGGKDLTGAGLAGMAGNVREWTAQPEINPDTPLAPKSHVAAGASFLQPKRAIAARLWTSDRSLRRADLGFRMILEK